jgi:hypothetical protein
MKLVFRRVREHEKDVAVGIYVNSYRAQCVQYVPLKKVSGVAYMRLWLPKEGRGRRVDSANLSLCCRSCRRG